jgi:hypothetical protein
LDRLEQQLHDLTAALRRTGVLTPSGSKPRGNVPVDDTPAPASVKRLWIARRNAVAAAIRRHAIETPRDERIRMNSEAMVARNAIRFRHVVFSVRLTKAFRDTENRPLTMKQVTPLILSAMQGIPGTRYVSGMESRARGLETSAACIIVSKAFDNATQIPEQTEQ